MWGLRKPSLFLELWVKSWISARLSWICRSVEVWSWFWNILKDWKHWIWVTAVSPIIAWICWSKTSTKCKTLSEWLKKLKYNIVLTFLICLFDLSFNDNSITDTGAEKIYSIVTRNSNKDSKVCFCVVIWTVIEMAISGLKCFMFE